MSRLIHNLTNSPNLVERIKGIDRSIDTLNDKVGTIPEGMDVGQSIIDLQDNKQDKLTAGEGISIENNVISNTQRSAEWGNISGNITNQTDLQNALDSISGSIPTNTSDLTNDSGFITNSVNNLINYYLKSETYTKTEVDNLIGSIQNFHYEIYPDLGSVTTPETNVLYLIGPVGTGSDKYEEYVYSNNNFVKIGDTSIDLSGYVTTTALNNALSNYTTTENLTTLLAGKQDILTPGNNITIENVCNKDTQGPSPAGYHIPTRTEWENLYGILVNTFRLPLRGTTVQDYLKTPRAGYRDKTSTIINAGVGGYYWASTAGSAGYANYFSFGNNDISTSSHFRAYAFPIRCFKDTSVIPDGSWITLYDGSSIAEGAGVFHNDIDGLISISGDGQNRYTIKDKNLGATSIDITSIDSYGYYYQWGNNYAFPTTGSVTTSSTQVNARDYGPGNYYNDSTFITGNNDWSSVRNDNLRGGATKGTWGCQNIISATDTTYSAGTNISIDANNQISAIDTTYTAGTGISIDANNVISNTQTSAEWGNITGTLSDQTDLINLINTKQDLLTEYNAGRDIEIINGDGGDETVTGNTSILLERAIEDGLNSVTLTGACEQRDVLPSEYQRVEYIQSSGTQHIDTGISGIARCTIEAQGVTSGNVSQIIIGSYTSVNSFFGTFAASGTWSANGTSNTGISYTTKGRFIVDFEENGLTITTQDGNSYPTRDAGRLNENYNFYLFRSGGKGSTSYYYATARIYYCKIEQNNNVVAEFIPARRKSDSTLGMYDIVRHQFFTNQGTDDFTAGADVTTPSPDNVMPIWCNNGELKVNNQGQIYTDGTTETVEDELGNTATAEMLLAIGNYNDTQSILDGEVTRNVGIKVLDGTESWEATTGNYYSLLKTYLGTNSTVLPFGSLDIICTHYSVASVQAENKMLVGNSYVNWYVPTAFTTLASWKQYLADQYSAGTPVIIIYPLATSTAETVTGQTLTTIIGDNTLTITQASIDILPIEANYDTIGGLVINFVNDDGFQTVANMRTNLNNPDDTHYPTTKAIADAIEGIGGANIDVEDKTLVITDSGGGGGGGGGDVFGPSSAVNGHLAVFDGTTGKLIKDGGEIPTPITVVDNLNSQSTTSALSANQGRILDGKIADMMGLGKFLSLWNSTTGLPISFPLTTPYAYTTGDYFIIEVTGTTNYKPTGSSYTGTASSTTESDEIEVGDVYVYDGQTWLLQSNHGKSVTFANIAGNPTDNTNLANALSNKQDVSNLVTSVSSSSTDSQYPSAKLFYDTCGDIETLINAL